MIKLYASNKTEHLSLVIAELMKTKPLADPFAKEMILIQSHGMGTWLQHEISEHLGIAAMIDCSMPASFIWALAQRLMPKDQHIPIFEKNNLRWQIFTCLADKTAEKLANPDYHALSSYIDGLSNSQSASSNNENPAEQVLFELSDVLADLFDAYQNYRFEWIDAWEKNNSYFAANQQETHEGLMDLERWQADLWRSVYSDIPLKERNHRAILLEKLLARIQQGGNDIKALLPERLFVFGLSALPPQWLPIISALSRYTEVHFLIQNPCQYYWGDVLSDTQRLKLAHALVQKGVSSDTAAETFLESNGLLASWGRLGRDYLSLLLDHDAIKEMPINLYEDIESDQPHALACLQSDILNLQVNQRAVNEDDKSILFASCHSHLREVEALHDYLFELLDQTADLSPKDVIVMMPDVQHFAALVDAVFSKPAYDQYGKARYLSYGISDQILALDQPLVDVFGSILNLTSLRVTATEVLDWLDIEAIRQQFNISEEDLEQIHAWVNGLAIRWGLSEKHRDKQLGLEGSGAGNTWMNAFKRLLAGYIYGVDGVVQQPGENVFAQTQSSRDMQLLAGRLMHFIDVIEFTIRGQSGLKKVDEWLAFTSEIWELWFDNQLLSEDVIRLMDQSISSVSEQVSYAKFELGVSFSTVAKVLLASFEKERVSQRFLAGRINFCTLMPMRSIPFKVVCMLGMNEGQYPRPEQKMSFDLLSITPSKIGDRSRREDDRYLFLEAICSARRHVYLSYCGHDIKDNSERYPSLLVSELQDYCEQNFYLEGQDISSMSILDHWLIKHRLQPFHADYYQRSSKKSALPQSYNSEWLALLGKNGADSASLMTDKISSSGRLEATDGELPQFDLFSAPEKKNRVYDLSMLSLMANHPLRFFYQNTLGISYGNMDSELEDSEPFALSHLDIYQLKTEMSHSWYENQFQADDSNKIYEQWSLSDKLPRAPVDKIFMDEAHSSLSNLKEFIASFYKRQQAPSIVSLDLEFDGDRLSGELLVSDEGLIELSIGKSIAGRFFGFWVKHVFWNVHCHRAKTRQQTALFNAQSLYVCVDKVWTLPALDNERAEQYAREILALYLSAEKQPQPFLARTSFASIFEKDTHVKSAFNGLNIGNGRIKGESEDPYWQRFCLYRQNTSCSQSEQDSTLKETNYALEQMPELSHSILYQQVSDCAEQIQIEALDEVLAARIDLLMGKELS